MTRFFSLKPTAFAVGMALSALSAHASDEAALGNTCLFCDMQESKAAQAEAADGIVQTSGEETLPADYTRIVADEVNGQTQVAVEATGNVIIERNQQVLNADKVSYDQASDTIQASGNVVLQSDNTTVQAEQLNYNLATESGSSSQARLSSEHEGRRFQAVSGESQMASKQRFTLKDVQFNTCQKGDASWYIHASEVNADYDKGVGVAKNARLVFGGLPVLYTPWADFPLNGNRKSGLLVPTVEIGSDGTTLDIPYYFNLAPNYDATLSAGGISSRGVRATGEFRYLQPKYRGTINGTYMPHDRQRDQNNRYQVQWQHQHQFGKNLSAGVDFNQVSDDNYYRDFYSREDIATNVNLNRQAWLQHQTDFAGGELNSYATVQDHQTLANSNGYKNAPYAIMPRISSTWQRHFGDTQAHIFGQFTRFEHAERQAGSRVVFYPSISHHFHNSWGYVRPKVGVHFTHYQLKAFNNQNKRSASRSVPIANIEAGTYFERNTQLFKNDYVQTLEPRLFYNYIPAKSQNDLPNFDASENSFSYAQLFRENLYSGNDRINASNSLTAAVQTRYLDAQTGEERLRAGIGQKFYFATDNVLLDGSISQEPRDKSDWLAFADGKISNSVRAHAVLHYNENRRQLQNVDTGLTYRPETGKVISLRYKYGRHEPIYLQNDGSYHFDKLKQISLGAQWPIKPNLSAVGSITYGLEAKKPVSQMLGFEYQSSCGCWSASALAQRYVNGIDANNNSTYKNGIMFSLQLKDLSSLGKSPKEQLRLAIPGYSTTNEVVKK
ncbi:MAG: LPS-assembly protein LptD [Neisseria sp.]|nr:LPS-assembly protein LptD [Neisseria sp.]